MNTVLLIFFILAFKPEVQVKKKDGCFGLTLCSLFKICSQFSKNACFEKFDLRNFNFLSIFSLVHACREQVENMVKE